MHYRLGTQQFLDTLAALERQLAAHGGRAICRTVDLDEAESCAPMPDHVATLPMLHASVPVVPTPVPPGDPKPTDPMTPPPSPGPDEVPPEIQDPQPPEAPAPIHEPPVMPPPMAVTPSSPRGLLH